jgi:predicted MFS family arabinose efflux permease
MGTDDRGLIRGIAWSFVVLTVAYALFPLAPGLAVAAVLVFLAHCGGGAQWTLSTLGLQRSTPDAIRGRVFSVDYGLVTLVIALSTLLAGLLADVAPPRVAVWTMVALVAAAGGAWYLFSRPALAHTPPAGEPVDLPAEDR